MQSFMQILWTVKINAETSLVVQCLRLHIFTAGGTGSNPGQGTKILHATWHSQKKKKNHQKIQNKK